MKTSKPADEPRPAGSGSIREWLAGLDRYWFDRGSPVSLGVFRIVMGFLAFLNFLMLSIDFRAWYTEQGFVPIALSAEKMPDLSKTTNVFGLRLELPFDVPRLNLLNGVTDTRFTLFIFILTIVAALFTMLGLWTRLSTILLALGTMSFHIRNGFIIHGGDTVLRVMLIYLALSPCGKACSLDRLIGLWKGRISREIPLVSLWSQRLIAYNVSLVYFTTFWHKMGGTLWRNGTATWYPARLHEFDRFPVPQFMNDPPMIYLTTYGTLAVELAMGTLVFYKPLRKYVLLGGLLLHASIEYTMNIPLFAFVICSCYLAYYSGEEVSGWAKRMGERLRKFRSRIFLPKGCALKPNGEAVLDAVNAFGLVSYEQGTTEDWEARNGRDETVNPVKASWTRSPGVWPVGWIPGVWRKFLNQTIEPVQEMEESSPPKNKQKKAGVS